MPRVQVNHEGSELVFSHIMHTSQPYSQYLSKETRIAVTLWSNDLLFRQLVNKP